MTTSTATTGTPEAQSSGAMVIVHFLPVLLVTFLVLFGVPIIAWEQTLIDPWSWFGDAVGEVFYTIILTLPTIAAVMLTKRALWRIGGITPPALDGKFRFIKWSSLGMALVVSAYIMFLGTQSDLTFGYMDFDHPGFNGITYYTRYLVLPEVIVALTAFYFAVLENARRNKSA